MKKFGILIFIFAIAVGVVFANIFSFGRVSGKFLNFSFVAPIDGSAVAGTEVRDLTGFQGVQVGGVFHVDVVAGKDFRVEVQADDNLLQYVRTDVENGMLKIATRERINSHTPLTVRVSAPSIENLDASGVCKISLEGVNNSALSVDTSGASKVRLAGETSSVDIDVSGASNIDAENLKAKIAMVEASGASKVSVFVSDRLVSKASGASTISYTGNPTKVEKSSSGASSVRPN